MSELFSTSPDKVVPPLPVKFQLMVAVVSGSNATHHHHHHHPTLALETNSDCIEMNNIYQLCRAGGGGGDVCRPLPVMTGPDHDTEDPLL